MGAKFGIDPDFEEADDEEEFPARSGSGSGRSENEKPNINGEDRGEELLSLSGSVEHIIYTNEENGYTVCEIATEDDPESSGEEALVTVVGTLPFVGAGENIRALGHWVVHPSFGRQFAVESFEKELPTTQDAILKYLSSRVIKGIGPKLAEKIVERFGEDSFDVIENHPEWLADVPGITKKKAQEASESFKEQFGVRSVMLFCRDFFGPATAVKVYKQWGGSAVDVIKENPYVLCEEIYSIGFERADRIARSLGIGEDSPYRVMAGIKYLLSYNATQNGHVYLPLDRVIPAAAQLLGVSEEASENAVAALAAQGGVFVEKIGSRKCVYLKKYYDDERYVAAKLDLLDKVCPKLDAGDIDSLIRKSEVRQDISYAPLQKKAISYAAGSGVMLLTGGPGTGKTTVIRAIIEVFEALDLSIVLAAPTGRAAKRMSEATSREAKTIHRLLEVDFSDESRSSFRRNEDDPLDEDVIIIDETSMVDLSLMASLLKAIRPGARLILIGDADQLPSVGAGNVLADILASDRFSTVKLKDIFRQAQESLIITNAHAINEGELPYLDSKDGDFFFIRREEDADVCGTIVDLCRRRLPATYGAEISAKIQVISPTRRGPAGTSMLNFSLQKALNPPDSGKKERKFRDVIFREGDKVMQIKNNYDIQWVKNGDIEGSGVFNGDIGTITEIRPRDERAVICFDDRVAEYEFSMFDELEHAYAVTIHKSQGSEYPVVIIPVCGYAPKMLTRNLLYTAVTRAQQMVILVGKPQVVAGMVANDRHTLRYGALSKRLLLLDR